jgi:hypothetical protein
LMETTKSKTKKKICESPLSLLSRVTLAPAISHFDLLRDNQDANRGFAAELEVAPWLSAIRSVNSPVSISYADREK